ncbi:MAG: hypothetical protein AB7K04_05055 [Pseudorhodoplanes sp.]
MVRFFVVLIFGLVFSAAYAQRTRDMRLEDAGFVMRPASTPETLERLKKLPPRTFVSRIKSGLRYVLYADPEDCRCVFVGSEQAFQAYRDMAAKVPQPDVVPPSGIQPQQFIMRDMDEALAQEIRDGEILDY